MQNKENNLRTKHVSNSYSLSVNNKASNVSRNKTAVISGFSSISTMAGGI